MVQKEFQQLMYTVNAQQFQEVKTQHLNSESSLQEVMLYWINLNQLTIIILIYMIKVCYVCFSLCGQIKVP